MIYKPKFLEPKNKAVDATVANVFSWVSQGEPQTHYQLKIYELPNTLTYDSTKIAGAVNQHSVPASTLTNNKEYKWTVETFGVSGSAVGNYVYLKTNSTPTVTLTVPASLAVQSYTVTATYAQAEGVSIKQHKFVLYDDADNVLVDTGWEYDYDLSYTIDGLISGNSYQIECIAIAQNDLQGTSGKQAFTVSYSKPDSSRSIMLTPDNDNGRIIVRWDSLKQVTPVVTGTYAYVDSIFEKGLQMDDGTIITYSEETDEYFTHQFYRTNAIDFEGKIIDMDDEFEFGFYDSRFYVVNQGIRFTSEVVDMSNIWEDVEHMTWGELAAKYATFGDLISPNLATYLFIQLTFENVVVKRNGRIIATIDMRY